MPTHHTSDHSETDAAVRLSASPTGAKAPQTLRQKLGEVVRFGIVGGAATVLQYAIYMLLALWIHPNVAMAIGYVVSFVFNFVASTRFTFRVATNARHGAGFAFSHLVDFCLQMVLLQLFLHLGLSKALAPVPMFCICVPVNFILVRFFLKRF